MSEPTDEEINKVIAEFMGLRWGNINRIDSYLINIKDNSFHGESKTYTESLDSLIPVVEKLEKLLEPCNEIELSYNREGWFGCVTIMRKRDYSRYEGEGTPSKALSLACYKAIKELEEK